ncbi:MAG: 16S rRNA (guanine(966)-N(2))-methyltransferase RsmD [Dokdonella sp.]
MRSRSGQTSAAASSSLRIIGGNLRGSRLAVLDADGLRPTSDRIRETLFNWLAPVVEGARCLDLFAGTGALGIEAISRGAASCVFVERDRALAEALGVNLDRLKIDSAAVVQTDAQAWLARDPSPFDIVFVDPPFSLDLWSSCAAALERDGWLQRDAWIYIEAPVSADILLPSWWAEHRSAQAGSVHYVLYRRRGPDPLS